MKLQATQTLTPLNLDLNESCEFILANGSSVLLELKETSAGIIYTTLLDPWILFWQMYRDRHDGLVQWPEDVIRTGADFLPDNPGDLQSPLRKIRGESK